ncbi:MAG: hypothetical protein ACOX3T_01635 [Bdellovibrionota bacterium]
MEKFSYIIKKKYEEKVIHSRLVAAKDGNFIAISTAGKIYKFTIIEDEREGKILTEDKMLLDAKCSVSYVSDIMYNKDRPDRAKFFIIDEENNLKKYSINTKDNTIESEDSVSLDKYISKNEKPICVLKHGHRDNVVYVVLASSAHLRALKLTKLNKRKKQKKETKEKNKRKKN